MEKGVEVMPRHVYVSVWDEATTQVQEERACSVLVSAIGGDKQFLWSPAGASLAAPPLRHAGGSGLRFFIFFLEWFQRKAIGITGMPPGVFDSLNASSLAQTELNSKIPSVASDFSLGCAFVFPNV